LKEFKNIDKKSLLETLAAEIWSSILDNSALKDPSKLLGVMFLTHADLKTHKFTFW